ncbi:MAG: hypothetical protein BWY80_01199 [Firmicutes bacterium ADurb.Bin456]|nr:MAG: hypothetical protein BWY80_01199 [Firmicutes bacterium ADurb.Bin456]
MKYILMVLVIALLVALLAVQNSLEVDIRFLWWELPGVSLVMIMISSFAGGALAAFLLSLARQIRSAWQIRELTGLNRQLAAEVERLKGETGDKLNQTGQ